MFFAVKTHRNPVGHIPEEYVLARDTLFFWCCAKTGNKLALFLKGFGHLAMF